MQKLSDKIVELRLALRRATMCESVDGKTKNTLSLKTKILFLIRDNPAPPRDLMQALGINKANLASIISGLEDEGLAAKAKKLTDKREITIYITDLGKAYLQMRLDYIENACRRAFNEDEYNDAAEKLQAALSILEFL